MNKKQPAWTRTHSNKNYTTIVNSHLIYGAIRKTQLHALNKAKAPHLLEFEWVPCQLPQPTPCPAALQCRIHLVVSITLSMRIHIIKWIKRVS